MVPFPVGWLNVYLIFQAMYNAAAFKARTKARAKFRDKRSVMVNGGD